MRENFAAKIARGAGAVQSRALGLVLALGLTLILASVLAFSLSSAKVAEAAPTLPSGFQESVVFSGLTNPSNVEFSSDGRVFVAEKSGVIKVFDGLSDTTPTTFADLSTNVHDFWDRGLLGLALAPNFPTDPSVYVLYTHDAAIGGTAPRWGDGCPNPPGATDDGCVVSGRLSKLQAGSGGTSTGSEQVLIEDWCQQYPSHSVGSLAFGSDGALYASGGDGASFTFVDYGQDGSPTNPCGDPPVPVGGSQSPPSAQGGALRSQDLRTSGDPVSLDGTITRVDPSTGAQSIAASGLRNPFRITTRPGTSEVWAGDVGWGSFEEINRIVNPADSTVDNFGWPCYEGTGRQGSYEGAGLSVCEGLYAAGAGAVTAPYYSYAHGQPVVGGETCIPGSGGSSMAGLAFYGGGSYPDAYDGALFFADYSRDCIWAMRAGSGGLPDPSQVETFVAAAENPVDLQIGPGGDLFYVDFKDGGSVRRISYSDPGGGGGGGGGGGTTCAKGEYQAEYYDGTLTPGGGTPTLERCEASIDNDWGLSGPGNGVGADGFAARWTGTHTFEAGTYTFSATADDGIRVWVDDQLLIDKWID